MLSYKVSHARSSVCAKVNALVRKLVFVKKKIQTSNMTPDTVSEAIAAGDNRVSASQSTIFPLTPKRTCSFASIQKRQNAATTTASGFTPSAFLRNP